MRRTKRFARRSTRRTVNAVVGVTGFGSAMTTVTTMLADGPTWLYPPSISLSSLTGIYLTVLAVRRVRL